ncbi:MAG TPA: hypothetical protein PKL73_19405 [Polyangiaceae bacterium]|nr:MAG: hypothetical protein BWY17_02212 [Deltaproteobacteria bacterium ADurb.Bin207]HNS99133.1 hypothetical protein [Polyangiaceae bacterium]HNZ24353.1 hypothetical protein [Polyangiaceae bacterium]HOD22625.1 hypothetical protein [Polyangiaceae bacterium]HOE50431.1 hypothetical protein [Polyangiaceae bacterium]
MKHQPENVRYFRVELVLRYTRISCMPYRATFPAAKVVQAQHADDAVRQACLCLDRDLEDILAQVNALNVSEVWVDILSVQLLKQAQDPVWNPWWFPTDQAIPSYIIVRSVGEAGLSKESPTPEKSPESSDPLPCYGRPIDKEYRRTTAVVTTSAENWEASGPAMGE